MAIEKAERGSWPEWFRFPETWFPTWRELFSDEGIVRVEEFEQEGTLIVRAEVPGMDPDEDVEISVANGMLTIRAERREERKEESKTGYRSEFRYGVFRRTLPLPAGATEQDVKATCSDGILEVRIPMAKERAEAKKVPVTRT
jgi:HSP20 family protein